MDGDGRAGDNPGGHPHGATVNGTGRPVVVPGVVIADSGAVLIDAGMVSLTDDASHWEARVRGHRLNRETAAAHDLLVHMGAGKYAAPMPRASALAGHLGTQHSHNPYLPSGDMLRARQQLRANTARLALEQRPVEGYCKRGLHRMTEDNKSGDHCRLCRNAFYRAQRAGITVEEELRRAA